jgi:hypothetical protein
MMVSNIFFQTMGFINGGKRSIRVSTVTVLWPICYIIIISSFNKINYFVKIIKIMMLAAWTIIIHTFILFFSSLFMISTPFFNIDVGYAIGFYNSFIEYTTHNIVTLIFIVPFILSLMITKLNIEYFSKSGYYLICFLLLVLVLISGRTSFQLNLVFFIFINVIVQMFRKNKFRIIVLFFVSFIFIIISLVVINYFYKIDIGAIFLDIKNKFDFEPSYNTSGGIRGMQFRALITSWKERPLLGWGAGVGTETYNRGATGFELVYIARLFQTGILGIILYFSYISWIIYRCILLIKKRTYLSKIMYGILNGFICFMIANATNPYLDTFDHMWVLYLPLAIINYDLLAKNKYSQYPSIS